MKRMSKVAILATVFVLILATTSFAGSWVNMNFSVENIGVSLGADAENYVTTPVVTTGDPAINFTVYGGSYGDTVKVEMQKYDYISGQG